MKKTKITDEELLSYLIGDCDPSLNYEIRNQLKDNHLLRKRLETLSFIKGEVKNAPVTFYIKKKQGLKTRIISRQVAFASILFFIGFFSGSKFEIFREKSIELKNVSWSISEPLSWDETQFLSLM